MLRAEQMQAESALCCEETAQTHKKIPPFHRLGIEAQLLKDTEAPSSYQLPWTPGTFVGQTLRIWVCRNCPKSDRKQVAQ